MLGHRDKATLITFACIGLSELCYVVFYTLLFVTDMSTLVSTHEAAQGWRTFEELHYFKAIYYLQFSLDNFAFGVNLDRWSRILLESQLQMQPRDPATLVKVQKRL